MTTSRHSKSMFSLPRKPSMNAIPRVSQPSVPPLSPSATSDTSSPVSEEEPSPTCRASKNEKKSSHIFARRSSNTGTLEMPLPPTVRVDLSADSEQSRQARGMLRSMRSLHAAENQNHRTLTRDFSLQPLPVSSMLLENCSSLKDQFLKIKERFSAPSPVTTPRETPRYTTEAADHAPDPTPTGKATIESTSTGSGSDAKPTSVLHGASSNASTSEQESISVIRADSEHATAGNGIAVDRVDSSKIGATFEESTKICSGKVMWPPNTHVERWYVEDNYFKGSMTCWTIEKGAELVARVAKVVSVTTASMSLRINPDVSLQWIGRQIWAVTVSLPLTRSGELKDEHLELASRIDEAIAAEEMKLANDLAAEGNEAGSTAAPSPAAGKHIVHRYTRSINNQVPTLVIREDEDLSAEDDTTIRLAQLTTAESHPSVGAQDSAVKITSAARATNEAAAANNTNTNPKASGSSVSTLLADEEELESHDDSSFRSHGTNDDNGDPPVGPLPLSWSMLSLSSLQSSSGDNSGGSGVSLTTTPLQNGDDARYTPEKTGWLKKKTGLNSWQQRYFELKGNRLYYFGSETDGIPRGAIILDHAHVLRGKGEHAMSFSITTSSAQHHLQIIKFSTRMSHQIHPRKSVVLRVAQEESEDTVTSWVTALNRASFYCHMATNPSSASNSFAQTRSFSSSPAARKKKSVPFYRLRSPSSSASSVEEHEQRAATCAGSIDSSTAPLSTFQHFGSVKYLQETDPLLWEIHPHDQLAIRKRASLARTKADYLTILSKYSSTFRQIFLPRPRPISLEQTLRDILPELFIINNILYGGGEENNGLENIFEVLDSYIKRFASAQEERVRAVSTLLQACARTISGGDSYFVVHSLLGNPFMIIRPAEARGHPIEIEISPTSPCQFLITVFSAFSFHHVDDVENFGDTSDTATMTPEPLLRVKTYHVQEFDFATGKSSRWVRIRTEGMKENGSPDSRRRSSWRKRDGSESGAFGALLDALS